MKSIYSILALSATVLLCAVSCSKDNAPVSVNPVDGELVSAIKEISLDDALKTLDNFVSEFDSDNLITKSASARKIASVETHYSGILAKTGEELPDAYIVNYENEEGFAVLGANTGVVPVVAYTEDGSFSTEDLENYFSSSEDNSASIEFDEEGFPLVAAKSPSIVAGAIGSSISNTSTTKGSTGSTDYVAPLVRTKWRQGQWDKPDGYNRHCTYNGHYAWTGCTTIALAQVMACNKYSDPAFNYSNMITSGDLEYFEYVDYDRYNETSYFIGEIFKHIVLYANKDVTASTIAEARQYLLQMDGYYNVHTSLQNSFTNAVVTTAKGMIREGKPVIVSAAGQKISDKHAWILDGYKYYNGDLYFHCNWGYGGAFDGYFSANWFCYTANNAIYDDVTTTQKAINQCKNKGEDISSDYNWWVSLLTYDHQ